VEAAPTSGKPWAEVRGLVWQLRSPLSWPDAEERPPPDSCLLWTNQSQERWLINAALAQRGADPAKFVEPPWWCARPRPERLCVHRVSFIARRRQNHSVR
jgi:hypothetical protein